MFTRAIFVILLSLSSFTFADAPTSQPTTQPSYFDELRTTYKDKTVEKDGVLTLTLPREDLQVTFDGYEVPASVTATTVQFWRCPCGRLLFSGQFCVADYESNDVVDSIRKFNFTVISVGPNLHRERPKTLLVRFQGEGQAADFIKMMKDAEEWIGDARVAPKKNTAVEEKK